MRNEKNRPLKRSARLRLGGHFVIITFYALILLHTLSKLSSDSLSTRK